MRKGERQRETERKGLRRCRDRNTERDYATYRGSKDRSRGREGARERQIMQLTEEAKTETQRQRKRLCNLQRKPRKKHRERERICNLTTNYNRLGYPPCQQAHNVHTSAGGVEPNHQLHDKKEQNRPNTSSKLKEQPRYKNTPPPPQIPHPPNKSCP